MSKLTKAIALLAPLGSESDPLHGFFDPERRKAMRTLLDQIERDRKTISQLNQKHQSTLKYITNLKDRMRLLRGQAKADETEIKNTHRAHVEFHEKAESVMGRLAFPSAETEARNKLARIAEIIGTTDVPESTLLARRQVALDTVLVELFDAKLKAVAEILDED